MEAEGNFADEESLERYRQELLRKTQTQRDFVASIARRAPFGVLEACSGNGRLLVSLGLAGKISRGVGWEVAASRVAFARRWTSDEKLETTIEHVRTDALAPPPATERFDVVACITGALAYFDSFAPDGARRLLMHLRDRAQPGGRLVVEVYPHAREVALCQAAGEAGVQLWQELPPGDPWRYYLSRLRYDETTGLLHHQKTFIHRTTGEVDDSREETVRIWTNDELAALVKSAGFVPLSLHDRWSDAPPAPGSPAVVLVAAAP